MQTTLRELIEQARQDPDSTLGQAVVEGIKSGRFDAAALREGIDLSSAGRPSLESLKAQKQNPLEEAATDIETIGTDIAKSAETRADKFNEIDQAERSGEQGTLRSLFQKFGEGAGFAGDTIFHILKGAGKAVLPQKTEEDIGGGVKAVAEKVAAAPGVAEMTAFYENLKQTDPALARDFEAVVNTGLLGVDLATIGAGGQAAKTATKVAARAADIAGDGAEVATKGAARVAAEIQGKMTGTSQETIAQGFDAARRGGQELDEYTKALRGETSPEELVTRLREGIDRISTEKTQNFGDMLKSIGGERVDTASIRADVQTELGKVGVKVTDDGKLDFSGSKFRTVPAAQSKLQAMYDEVANLGDEQTVLGIDTSRQALKALELAGDDASARTANMVITAAKNRVADAGKKVPGYREALLKFGEDAEFLDELNRSLSSTDKATIDTAYRKLATALKTNNEQRMRLLQELDEATDGYVLSGVAGQQLSEWLPRGLVGVITGGGALGIASGAIAPGFLPGLVLASPRVTGEVVRALGIGARKADEIIKSINEAREQLFKGGKPPGFSSGAVPETALKPDPSFTGPDAQVNRAAVEKFNADPESMVEEYIRQNGNVVNTDEARKLFADVGYTGANSAAVHDAAKAVSDLAFTRLLERAKPGQDAFFMAGGSGAGKSTATREFAEQMQKAGLVFDGNLSSYDSAIKKLKAVDEKGLNVTIPYVYRDPAEAWNGVVSRMLGDGPDAGRVVPLKVFLENTPGALDVVKRLVDERYIVVPFKNSAGLPKEKMTLDELSKLSMPGDLEKRLVADTEEFVRKGLITDEVQYEKLLEGLPHRPFKELRK